MVRRWGDPQAECQMSTINKHYCPVSADIKHTSSILLASYKMYTSPASPWLISDFNLLCRPLREGSLLFIYIVRFIYRDGETSSGEEQRGLSLQTCQRGQGHYEAQLAACPHNCFSQQAHSSPRIAAVTHLGFQIFCTQSTIHNEDQDCEIHRKIQLMATLRSGSLQADDGGRGEVRWSDTRRHN